MAAELDFALTPRAEILELLGTKAAACLGQPTPAMATAATIGIFMLLLVDSTLVQLVRVGYVEARVQRVG